MNFLKKGYGIITVCLFVSDQDYAKDTIECTLSTAILVFHYFWCNFYILMASNTEFYTGLDDISR